MTEIEAASLSTAFDCGSDLERLDLSDNLLGVGVSAVAAHLHHLEYLTNLNLSNTEMTEKEAAELMTALVHVPQLKSLDLSHNSLGPGVSSVAANLQHLKEMEELKLCDTEMTEKEAAELTTALVNVPELHELDISDNPRVGRGVIKLAEQLATHVTDHLYVVLYNTGMEDECRQALEEVDQAKPTFTFSFD